MRTITGGVTAAALAVAVGAAGCGKKQPPALKSEELAALANFAKSLEAIQDASPGAERAGVFLAEAFAESSGQKCFSDYASSDASAKLRILAVDCNVVCRPEVLEQAANAEPGRKLPMIVEACGPEKYGLTKADSYMASETLLVMERVAAWYYPLRAKLGDGEALAGELDRLTAAMEITVPLPPGGAVELPEATSRDVAMGSLYVVVGDKGLTGGKLPAVRLGKQGIEWVRKFPGDPVTPEALGAKAAAAAAPPPEPEPEEKPAEKPAEEPDGTGMALDEGKMGKKESDRAEGQYKMKSHREAGVLGAMAMAKTPAASDQAVMVLAARTLPAAKLIAALQPLPGLDLLLGVGGSRDPQARAHRVALGVYQRSREGWAEPQIALFLGDDGYFVRAAGQTTKAAEPGELEMILKEARGLGLEGVILGAAGDKRTVADLAMALDALDVAGLRYAYLSSAQTLEELADSAELGLIGNEVGEMDGGFGLGKAGTGPGGGAPSEGTIGSGGYGTGKPGGKTAVVPKVSMGNAQVVGDLDKNIIRRYIRRELPKIQYCYEKQLLVKPGLIGTVTVQFIIRGDGTVSDAKASGLGDEEVEGCIAAVIKRITFPKPTGGGLVKVSYPFTLRPPGG